MFQRNIMISPDEGKADKVDTKKSGFALVIALALMGFIVLLLLSLVTFSQVELRSTQQQQQQLLAQQNALLAASVALGELQFALGSDRRVSATAGILKDDDYANENQHWVGVWSTGDWNPTEPSNRQFVTWLNSTENRRQISSSNTSGVGEPVLLYNSLDSDGSDASVRMIPNRIEASNSKWAFWVTDHSLKATIGLADPFERERQSANSSLDRIRRTVAHQNNFSASSQFSDDPFDGGDWMSASGRFQSMRDLPLLNDDWADEDWLLMRHDFTYQSNGLLTNTRDGGWRKDLTLAFREDGVFNDHFSGRRIFNKEDYGAAFRTSAASGKGFFGPRWEILRDFANIGKTLPKNGNFPLLESLNHTPRNENNAQMDAVATGVHIAHKTDPMDHFGSAFSKNQSIVEGGFPIEPINNVMVPVVTYFSTFYRIEAVEVAPDSYQLRMIFFPIVHLWNPFNVAMEIPSGTTILLKGSPRFEIRRETSAGIPTLVSVNGNDNFRLRDARNASSDYTVYWFTNEGGERLLQPGEVRVFSLGSREVDRRHGTHAHIAGIIEPFWDELAGIEAVFNTNPPQFNGDDILHIRWAVQESFSEVNRSDVHDGNSMWVRFNMAGRSFVEINRIYATGSSNLNDPVFLDSLRVIDIAGTPLDLGGIEGYLKPAVPESAGDTTRIFANYNPTAIVRGLYPGHDQNGYPRNMVIRATQWQLPQINPFPLPDGRNMLRGYWGGGRGPGANGFSFLPFIEVPEEAPLSLAGLQHARLGFFENQSMNPIGNAILPDYINTTRIVDFRNSRTQIDMSWMLNDKLYDSYFFSSVPAIGEADPLRPGQTFTSVDLTSNPLLSNSRYSIKTPSDEDPEAIYEYERSAAHLSVRGQFNVNSTSEEAWRVVLASLRGDAFNFNQTPTGTSQSSGSFENVFFRFSEPVLGQGGIFQSGWKALSDSQIQDLASELVKQIRLRGPFMSMADFVNRRLAAGEAGLSGTIQAAIDAAGINNAALSEASLGQHAPGTLSQADVLSALDPFLSARGDTFTIRAYGSVENLLGGRPVQAWCELLVQRTPQYVNRSDNAYWEDEASLTPENRTFGRRFEIIGFRWLNEEEL